MGGGGNYGRTGILWEDRNIMREHGYYGRTGILWEDWNIMGGAGYYGRRGILMEPCLFFFERIESLPQILFF